ncbi:MAG: RNA polymerase sigma factor [Bacteroidales bacterium]|jgi:RNA polymerase sigma-70 factor (ECF subfamily)|nr:RNA polymerase sigma factor [Bacteroidales bacterium]
MVFNEEKLIEGVKRGNSQCQSLFYNKYASLLYGMALRYTQSDDDAKDVLQEAFIKIFDNIEQYSGKGAIGAWMVRIVINQALKLYQWRQRHLMLSLDDENYPEIKDESIVVSDTLSHEMLLNFIRELPEGYRMVFNLCEIEGYSHEEVAEILNCSASTSRSQLSKAKNTLRKKINDFNERETRTV